MSISYDFQFIPDWILIFIQTLTMMKNRWFNFFLSLFFSLLSDLNALLPDLDSTDSAQINNKVQVLQKTINELEEEKKVLAEKLKG